MVITVSMATSSLLLTPSNSNETAFLVSTSPDAIFQMKHAVPLYSTAADVPSVSTCRPSQMSSNVSLPGRQPSWNTLTCKKGWCFAAKAIKHNSRRRISTAGAPTNTMLWLYTTQLGETKPAILVFWIILYATVVLRQLLDTPTMQ